MKTLIHTRIYALLTQNESNPSELAHAYEEFIETMTEMVANFDNRDDILRILYYSRVEFDVLSHPSFNRYSNNVLRTTFIYKIMYIQSHREKIKLVGKFKVFIKITLIPHNEG